MTSPPTHTAAVLKAKATDLVLEKRLTPSPGPDEVLIRNHAVALNPIDWKRQATGFMVASYPVILGADVSGVVEKVGPAVTTFRPGDRVIGFADAILSGNNDHGAYQEYTITKTISTTPLPSSLSFKQGVVLATATGTASMALFDVLGLPRPGTGNTAQKSQGILVWGGGSTVGHMTIQLARLAGLTVFTTASESHEALLKSLGAGVVIDYHSPRAVDDLLAAADRLGTPIAYAIDAISNANTLTSVARVLSNSSHSTRKIACTVPWPADLSVPEGIQPEHIRAEQLWSRRQDLSVWLCNDMLPKWLERGDVVPQSYRVVDGGIGGLQDALDELKKGVSGEKLVVEV